MMWRNLALEKKVVKKMRTDVHSYDGTGLMNEADQRLWRAFVKKEERSRRHELGNHSDEEEGELEVEGDEDE